MYCGSCMHDNAVARALVAGGVDCLLQPVYTPIRTDEISVATDKVFFGGIHVYLLQQLPWLRHIPGPIRRTLDWPPLLKLVTKRSHATDASTLGALAVSMLQGSDGNQADEVARLTRWLADDIRPDAVMLTNLLIGGSLPSIRAALPEARLCVFLQGDDIFLDYLPREHREKAISLCRKLVPSVDRFIVHSQFYADKMGGLLNIPDEKIVVTPLSIDVAPFRTPAETLPRTDKEFRLGYLARIAPEKGLHHLIDALLHLGVDAAHDDLTLHAAGWLGDANRGYLNEQQKKVTDAKLDHRFTYHGSPTLTEKIAYLRTLDLFCVPTDYHDPKGLFVLEALAAGVPVLQPDHGAFGELITATGGGRVYRPGSKTELIDAILAIKSDHAARKRYGTDGATNVMANHTIQRAAERMKEILFGETWHPT